MGNRHWVLGAIVSALLACSMAVSVLHASGSEPLQKTAAQLCATTGLRPFDLTRILLVLMLVHYLLAVPALITKTRRVLARSRSRWHRARCASRFALHLGLQVAVPAAFCFVVEGGQHAIDAGIHLGLA